MKPARRSFDDHPFRWPPRARRDICVRSAPTMGFTPENRFGAGGKRGLRWSQRQAGLAVQPFFGLGFRLRWSGSAVERLTVFGYELAATARVLTVSVYVLTVSVYVLTVSVYVLTVSVYVLTVFAYVLTAFVHEFRGIGADWGVWEAPSPCFLPLPHKPFNHRHKGSI